MGKSDLQLGNQIPKESLQVERRTPTGLWLINEVETDTFPGGAKVKERKKEYRTVFWTLWERERVG